MGHKRASLLPAFLLCHLRLLSVLVLFCLLTGNMIFAHAASQLTKESQQQIVKGYGSLPLSFEQNEGQVEPRVRFQARGANYSILLEQGEADFLLSSHSR
jgi:hypothetical protein